MPLARASTETEAANAALRVIGVEAIADVGSGTSKAARECRAAFGDARDETLRAKEWNFAAAWATPALSATPALGRLKKAYPLPADCVRVRSVDGLSTDDWAVETIAVAGVDTTVLVTNAEAPLVGYTRRILNVALWDAEFLAAFANRLAAKVAPPLSKEFTAGEQLDAIADDKVETAARIDAREMAPTSISRETSWIRARR